MGFNSVFKVLKEVFPQYDARILRAVAVEHSNDADAAVEAVLLEVIPFLSERSYGGSLPNVNVTAQNSLEGAYSSCHADGDLLASSSAGNEPEGRVLLSSGVVNSSVEQVSSDNSNEDLIELDKTNEIAFNFEPIVTMNSPSLMENSVTSSADGDTESAEIMLLRNTQKRRTQVINEDLLTASALDRGDDAAMGSSNVCFGANCENSDGSTGCSVYVPGCALSSQNKLNIRGDSPVVESADFLPSSPFDDALRSYIHKELNIHGAPLVGESTDFLPSSPFGDSMKSFIHLVGQDIAGADLNKPDSGCSIGANTNKAMTGCAEGSQEYLSFHGAPLIGESADVLPSSPFEDATKICIKLVGQDFTSAELNKPDSSCPIDATDSKGSSTMEVSERNNLDSGSLIDATGCKGTSTTEISGCSATNAVVSQSSQVCRVDLLEDMIKDARRNKQMLFFLVEGVVDTMREVELREREAEEAKEEAAKEMLEILSKVDDVKNSLKRARDAHDTHAGEVYGEKAILATEARELQSRLLSLSKELDNSLEIIKEIHEALNERLHAAEGEIIDARNEMKVQKNYAQRALEEQEILMFESEMLKAKAEENAKLREFLMDRGRVVDMLQGEMSVICQDLKLLKERIDDPVPFSKSGCSTLTSCILAASMSSSRKPEVSVDQEDSFHSAKHASFGTETCVDDAVLPEHEKTRNEPNEAEDDGWDIFDSREAAA